MRPNHFSVLVVSFLALTSSVLASTTWYVNGMSGSDSNNCLSATTACKTIGHAISLAASGDTIRTAAATYTEHLTLGISLKLIGSSASTTIIDGGTPSGGSVIAILNGSDLAVSNLTIRNGRAQWGGGITRVEASGGLSITSSIITGNGATGCRGAGAAGGGVANVGTLTITNSTITGNTADATCIGTVAEGGGIANFGPVTINKSTITGNRVSAPGCMPTRTSCTGGVAKGGGIFSSSPLIISNSTISGNSTSAQCAIPKSPGCRVYGGGIAVGTTMTMASSTVSGNSALCVAGHCRAYGGGISSSSAATIQNSIVANSSGGNCDGSATSRGYNLSSDNTCNFNGPGDLNNTDPKLGILGFNGGPTQTIPLLSVSPAIDAGNPNGCTDANGHLLTTDQRGMPRHDKEDTRGCDMGAFELQSD
jgi:hypothetical protein